MVTNHIDARCRTGSHLLVLSVAGDMFDVDVPGPSDGVRDHEAPHEPCVASTDPTGPQHTLVAGVPSAQGSYNQGIHLHLIALHSQGIGQGGVFFHLTSSGFVEGRGPVLKGDRDVDEDDLFLGLVGDYHVRSQLAVSTGDGAVHGDLPQARCDGFHQAVLDGIVAQLLGSGVGLAAAQDVGQGLVGVATLPATLVSVPVADGSIERDAVEPGAVDEPPVSETGEAAPGKEAVAGVPLACQFEGFILVQFMLQGFHVQ
ncbi:uncharacterized protein [Lepidochelys kempii]|uniref:uncharacterized protein n=1 Tax=Lepidochelys kempii TaxID=8472 RepID=UPI003C6FD19A